MAIFLLDICQRWVKKAAEVKKENKKLLACARSYL